MPAGSRFRSSDGASSSDLVVEHGGIIARGNDSSVDPDRHVVGRTSIDLLVVPRRGAVDTENGHDHLAFPPNDVRSVCDGRKPATTVAYGEASPKRSGTDTFTLASVSVGGSASEARFTVTLS